MFVRGRACVSEKHTQRSGQSQQETEAASRVTMTHLEPLSVFAGFPCQLPPGIYKLPRDLNSSLMFPW